MSGTEWLLTFKYFTEQKKKKKSEYEFFIVAALNGVAPALPPSLSLSLLDLMKLK